MDCCYRDCANAKRKVKPGFGEMPNPQQYLLAVFQILCRD